MKTLILFTASFPFGQKETYLETELKYLSVIFDQIEIFPHYYNNKDITHRRVPENVLVHEPVLPLKKINRLKKGLIGIFKGANISSFLQDFLEFKVHYSRKRFFDWLTTFIDYSATINSRQFKILRTKEDSLFYFYWGRGWSFSLLNLDHTDTNTYYLRLHGGDAYLDRSFGYIPLRKNIFNKADYLLPISNHLSTYLKETYLINPSKLIVSRLGVDFDSIKNIQKSGNTFKIVSCSNLIPLKRIDLILKALLLIQNISIKWIHFGDGPELENLLKMIKSSKSRNISIEFKGRKNNSEVLEYYDNNYIDAFVNVSEHEGLPVSIMEAMSRGIPCIATDAGATSEIVNNDNGILLPNDVTTDKLAKAICAIDYPSWVEKRELAYSHCERYFKASTNYIMLGNSLISQSI
jgi:glycosyltransferase involved in cell wall biosynthesis